MARPAKTEKQRNFMGAELARKRAGKKTKTGMSEKELEKMASKKNSSQGRTLRHLSRISTLKGSQRRVSGGFSPGER